MGYRIRPMRADDIPQLVCIDREVFPTQWPPTNFKRELTNRMAHYLVASPEDEPPCATSDNAPPSKGLLSRITSRVKEFLGVYPSEADEVPPALRSIVGYIAFWMMADEAHITSIAVYNEHRRRGLGELLLISAIDLAAQHNAILMTLEVRASNHAAQRLYEKYGFCIMGSRRAYYSDDKEDALIMTTDPFTSPQYWTRFQELKHAYVLRCGDILAPALRQKLLEAPASQSRTEIRG